MKWITGTSIRKVREPPPLCYHAIMEPAKPNTMLEGSLGISEPAITLSICRPLARIPGTWRYRRTSPPHALIFYFLILALPTSSSVIAKVDQKKSNNHKNEEHYWMTSGNLPLDPISQGKKRFYLPFGDKKSKFRVLPCTPDETDIDAELWSKSCQDFDHVTHAKAPFPIVNNHIYVRRKWSIEAPLTGGLSIYYVQENNKMEPRAGKVLRASEHIRRKRCIKINPCCRPAELRSRLPTSTKTKHKTPQKKGKVRQ